MQRSYLRNIYFLRLRQSSWARNGRHSVATRTQMNSLRSTAIHAMLWLTCTPLNHPFHNLYDQWNLPVDQRTRWGPTRAQTDTEMIRSTRLHSFPLDQFPIAFNAIFSFMSTRSVPIHEHMRRRRSLALGGSPFKLIICAPPEVKHLQKRTYSIPIVTRHTYSNFICGWCRYIFIYNHIGAS